MFMFFQEKKSTFAALIFSNKLFVIVHNYCATFAIIYRLYQNYGQLNRKIVKVLAVFFNKGGFRYEPFNLLSRCFPDVSHYFAD